MSKGKPNSKLAKKQPVLTPKEKRTAKQVKKHASDSVPLIVR
jgi:hypothetical protein